MKIIIIILLVISMLLSVGCSNIQQTSSSQAGASGSSDMVKSMAKTHYGGAVLLQAAREKSSNIYSTTDIVKLDGYQNFDRQVVVNGLTLLIHKDIKEDFVNKVTKTMVSMFPKLEGEKQKTQENILQNMYRYKAALPLVPNEEAIGSDQEKITKNYSLCDIIMKVEQNQENEVVEHLLHAITDVGLSYTFPEEWGFDPNSEVSKLMKTAIDQKFYEVKDYQGYPEEIKHRVLVQEYAYWVISSDWGFQTSYGHNKEEWKLLTHEDMLTSHKAMVSLIEKTVNPYMVKPSDETIKSFK